MVDKESEKQVLISESELERLRELEREHDEQELHEAQAYEGYLTAMEIISEGT